MKILISTFGIRGDVQPYLALAVGLQDAGHRVTLATSYNYTEWIQAYGVEAHPTRFNMQEFMQTPEAQAILKSRNLIRQVRMMRGMMSYSVEAQDDVWAALQDADFVIQSPTGSGAMEAASQRGIPAAFILHEPAISAAGSVAWASADATFKVEAGGQEMAFPARFTGVFEKRDDQWLVAQAHFSLPAPDQEAGSSVPNA